MRVPSRLARTLLLAAAALGLAAPPALAGSNRVWVSGHGVDQAGCGALTSPCRSLQYAHDNQVNTGGEIDILDPAGYGAITITKALSIVNDGVGTAGVQASSGNAITIAAGPNDAVFLKGIDIDGVQRTGQNGVEFDTGGRLVIDRCVIREFGNQGVLVLSSASEAAFQIFDSLITENGAGGTNAGMAVAVVAKTAAPVSGVLDRVTAVDNGGSGLWLTTSGGGAERVNVAVSNSNLSQNAYEGVVLQTEIAQGQGSVVVTIDNSVINASQGGLIVNGSGARAHLARSVVDGNLYDGVSTDYGGVVYTAGDNHIEENHRSAVYLGSSFIPDTWR